MKNVKINFSIFSAALAFAPLAAFSQTDYYFNPESAGQTKFFSGNAWTYDAAGAERTSSAPLSTDAAYILNKDKADDDAVVLELDTVEAYVGELVVAGNAQNAAMIVFGNAALDNTAVFEIGGSIKSLVGPTSQNYFAIGGSFWTTTGQKANVVVRSKGFELGAEGYGGGYSGTEILRNVFTVDFKANSPIERGEFIVDGDMKLGGYGYSGTSETSLVLNADRASVSGVVNMQSDGSGWTNIKNAKNGMVFEIGGLRITDESHIDCGIYNSPNSGVSSTLVFTNAAGTDYRFKGNVSDFGYLPTPHVGAEQKLDVVMNGEGTQRIHIYRAGDMAYTSQSGTFTINNGRFFMGNEQIREEYRNATLVLNGGIFGAYNSGTEQGFAYFKEAVFRSGGIAIDPELYAAEIPGLIAVSETLSKDGAAKIAVDFSGAYGNLNPADYGIELAQYGADYSEIGNWTEILTAADLSGFDLGAEVSENVYDASADFYGAGLENAVAVFRWVKDSAGYSLQVGMTQVPEPSVAAAILGAASIAFAARRRRFK
ncbi:MAG: hypothetical protein BHW65_08725 [Verrucomicrobia bacterium CAG:312_58_20]|nr:MAG: hypothetical protein BHW65_08725 [Verrucomicrobia bacterium CAG:312_58_20]